MRTAEDRANRRRMAIFLGSLAAFVVGGIAWLAVTDEDEPEDLRSGAETVCRMFVERRVDPLDVEHRDIGASTVTEDGDTFQVQDRAAIGGDLVNYTCEVTHRSNGDWKLEQIRLR